MNERSDWDLNAFRVGVRCFRGPQVRSHLVAALVTQLEQPDIRDGVTVGQSAAAAASYPLAASTYDGRTAAAAVAADANAAAAVLANAIAAVTIAAPVDANKVCREKVAIGRRPEQLARARAHQHRSDALEADVRP